MHSAFLKRLLRVDYEGEHGAVQIYKGQRAILGDDKDLVEMEEQEKQHLEYFQRMMIERGIQPSLFHPLWHAGAYALGVVTALMGKETAHACTIAVEDVIDNHYQDNLRTLDMLPPDETIDSLRATITQFHEDECHHRDMAIKAGGQGAPCYHVLTEGIRKLTRGAIWLSSKI